MDVLNNLNLTRNQLLNARLQNLAVDPTGLTATDKGLIWIDAAGIIRYFDGDTIESLGVAGAGAPPSGAAGGELAGSYPNPTIADGVIDNANVAPGAAIAQSKLSLAITDAEVAAGAAIDLAKLAVNPLSRANHQGTQTSATISDFATAVNASVTKEAVDALNVDADTIDGIDSASLELLANKNAANGYAGLGADGKLPDGLLPNLAISETFVVASEAAMLAVAARRGDIAVRTDTNETFILSGDDPTILANWTELVSPVDGVQSVSGSARISSTGGVNPVLDLVADSITSGYIADGAVGTGEIADAAVTDAKIVSVAAAKVTGAIRKFSADVGDGAATTIVVAHNLNTLDVQVQVRGSGAPRAQVVVDNEVTDANNVTLRFTTAPAAGAYRVTVVG